MVTTTDIESFREGYSDALAWVLANVTLEDDDRERIEKILDAE